MKSTAGLVGTGALVKTMSYLSGRYLLCSLCCTTSNFSEHNLKSFLICSCSACGYIFSGTAGKIFVVDGTTGKIICFSYTYNTIRSRYRVTSSIVTFVHVLRRAVELDTHTLPYFERQRRHSLDTTRRGGDA